MNIHRLNQNSIYLILTMFYHRDIGVHALVCKFCCCCFACFVFICLLAFVCLFCLFVCLGFFKIDRPNCIELSWKHQSYYLQISYSHVIAPIPGTKEIINPIIHVFVANCSRKAGSKTPSAFTIPVSKNNATKLPRHTSHAQPSSASTPNILSHLKDVFLDTVV